MAGLERSVRAFAVATHAKDERVVPRNRVVIVAESTGLGGAARREVFRVEVQDDVLLAPETRKFERGAIIERRSKFGSGGANFKHSQPLVEQDTPEETRDTVHLHGVSVNPKKL